MKKNSQGNTTSRIGPCLSEKIFRHFAKNYKRILQEIKKRALNQRANQVRVESLSTDNE